ncbi:hypothetical protein MSAN_00136800 [Mycena sanguinolenta]|uniref:Uncharacterized protein n=1 Tax=Mycena sanguinolenta TaxID=230812 RepID=A0A8H6ZDS1_9AGAR|nr:hypothetical protein MSAN_00136800 [Mycena sanguinolenta]
MFFAVCTLWLISRIMGVDFELDISETIGGPPEGFLFLCPPEDFRTGPSSFGFPACPAYWSLDPSGIDFLSPEDATRLGFPSFKLTTAVHGYSWRASVYNGLRQFHRAKGFDPYSQDLARHLKLPLYQLSYQFDAAFARATAEDLEDSDRHLPYSTDPDSEGLHASTCGEANIDSELSCSGEDDPDIESESYGVQVPGGEYVPELPTLYEELPWALQPIMGMKFFLILFLGLSWVYEHV